MIIKSNHTSDKMYFKKNKRLLLYRDVVHEHLHCA